ncbi:SIMPL domain-containing protein [Uruburuella testudinis]|uniref:SIMPL domain-containing protein n=1 Tax=Uruburuella testudinis TaxID=1282863 RepID=A0ABY4DVJ1_9NEIS|nr:SIMPL domain-containing protein [Uruburuella testudinis]UOO82856.1 SIMPL domain-containing protein [Uruburuella testudinis]
MATHSPSKGLVLLGITLAIGLIAAAFVLGMQFKNFRQPGTITVKGLAEKSYQADRAEWQTSVAVHGDTYAQVLAQLQQAEPVLARFLTAQGFNATEVQRFTPMVEPAYTEVRQEDGSIRQVQNGYQGEQRLLVSSSNLTAIQKAQQAVLQLRADNEAIRFEQPQYLLGNLETIKHALITQATEDAHKRAQEFAKTGGAAVGAMRSASQGSFNIYAEGGGSSSDDYGGVYDKTTIGKNVRLVVTIEYGIGKE